MAIHFHRPIETIQHAPRDNPRLFRRSHIRQIDDELITALPGQHAAVGACGRCMHHGVGDAHGAVQPHCHFAQQTVARAMTQRVVDALEVIQIDEQHRGAAIGQWLAPQVVADGFAEIRAIGEPGQAIEVRQPVHMGLRAALGAQRPRQLSHLVRMKRLLQEEKAVGRQHALDDRCRIDIGIGRADDDVHFGIQMTDVLGGP